MSARIVAFRPSPRRQRGHFYISPVFVWCVGLAAVLLGLAMIAGGAWLVWASASWLWRLA